MELTIAELAKRIGADLIGDGSARITGISPVAAAGAEQVTFVSDSKHRAALVTSGAAAVIVDKRVDEWAKPQMVVCNINAALIDVMKIFAPRLKAAAPGIDPSARVGQNVKIGMGASIGPCAVLEDGVEIGDNTVIGAGCQIGQNCRIGANSRLDGNVVVYHNCTIGNNVVIQANTTIGSVGFGYAFIDGAHRLIPHIGAAVIEDYVEIGANCCVDRAKFGQTRIGAGTKIDNLVQIGNNVIIGKCCLIAGQVGISGSCKLGDGVVLAGQVGLADNIEIGAGTMLGAKAGLSTSVGPGKQLLGAPAIDRKEAIRVLMTTLRLPKYVEQLRDLAARVEKLEASKDDKR